MDEPSTGLDPASRNMLWNVVKQAKQNRAIILTSNDFALILCFFSNEQLNYLFMNTFRFINIPEIN